MPFFKDAGNTELSWTCVTCGASLRGKFRVGSQYMFVECKTCLEQYTLSRVENLQQEAVERAKLPPQVHLRDKKGNVTYPGCIGRWNEGLKGFSNIGGFVGGGAIGMSLVGLTKLLGSKDQDKIRKRIEKNPYRYPFTTFEVYMFCPKCDMKVRADQETCEHCSETISIPPCNPVF